MDILLRPLQYGFFVNGLVAAALVGVLTGIMGVFIVLRRMSYIGHGLSHAVFGGAVVSYVLGWSFYLGAGLWGFISALLINLITKKHKVGADAAIGIVTTASFAVGVALISRVRHFTRNFDAALFGNVLGVTRQDIVLLAIVTVGVVIGVYMLYKLLLFLTFDEEVARAYGVPVEWLDGLFAFLLAATIIVSIQIMGVTLIAATVVIPASCARLLTHHFGHMLCWSVVIGTLSGILGMYISFYGNIASGATIVLLEAAVFVLIASLASARLRYLSGDRAH